jgi:hypothetical protein
LVNMLLWWSILSAKLGYVLFVFIKNLNFNLVLIYQY